MELTDKENQLLTQYASRKDLVLKLLRAAILDGRLKAGQRLDQNEIAETFNVSRMPVREALKQLEAEGFVTIYPYRKVEVTRLDLSEVSDLFAIRGTLERLAAGRAIEHMTAQTFDELRVILLEMDTLVDAVSDADGWAELNRKFHYLINSASRSPRLMEAITTYRDKVDRYIRVYFSRGGRTHSQLEHWAILRALEARDRAKAEQLIESHANSTAALLVADVEKADILLPSTADAVEL